MLGEQALQVCAGGLPAGKSRSPVPRMAGKVSSRYSSIRSPGDQRVHGAHAAGDDHIEPLVLDGVDGVADGDL